MKTIRDFRLAMAFGGCLAVLTAAADTGEDHSPQLQAEGSDALVELKFDARMDAHGEFYGHGADPRSRKGFEGSYFNLMLSGQINSQFSYNFRYRMCKDNGDEHKFMNSTDWVYLTYAPNEHWSVSAGKQMVMVGGMEYDYAPIDVYYASDFWNHVNPYQLGVNVGLKNRAGQFYAQITNSPFSESHLDDMFAYNLIWYGQPANWFQTIWSANLVEYAPGRHISYLSLGNRFHLGQLTLDADYMNRYGGHDTPVFADYTLIGKAQVDLGAGWQIFAKGGYDHNTAQRWGTPADQVIDRCVTPGTRRKFWGGGLEYYPKNTARNKIRLHLSWDSSTDQPRCQNVLVGIRWQMNVFKIKSLGL